jgi:hypothetical protein
VEQQLVLQRGEPVLLAQQLAEAQEATEAVAEVREPLVVALSEASVGRGGWLRHGEETIVAFIS